MGAVMPAYQVVVAVCQHQPQLLQRPAMVDALVPRVLNAVGESHDRCQGSMLDALLSLTRARQLKEI